MLFSDFQKAHKVSDLLSCVSNFCVLIHLGLGAWGLGVGVWELGVAGWGLRDVGWGLGFEVAIAERMATGMTNACTAVVSLV